MSLVLEIEHLLGVSFAARGPADARPAWPPQPDRVFSALVAAWGSRGQRPGERRALEWLEAQAVPEIAASGGFPRTAPTVFVPPNDPETRRVADRTVMPMFRRRQPRRFPAYRPHDPVAFFVWEDISPDDETLMALNTLASATPYIGHSASLTRCRFLRDPVPAATDTAKRCVYPGRLAELERLYGAGQRPGPGDDVRSGEVPAALAPHSVFSDQWLVLDHIRGTMPDLRAAAMVAKALRKTLMAAYEQIGLGDAIPAEISGHAADGAPLAEPHLAFAPLAFLGHVHADGSVLGFALIPPAADELLQTPSFLAAMRGVSTWNERDGRRELNLNCDGLDIGFSIGGDPRRRSLDPAPYVAASRCWATSTPIVLDRHLKAIGGAARADEMAELVSRACVNIGLPAPARVVLAKHSAITAAPSASPSGKAPPWTGWRLPTSLASRGLTHGTLQFAEAVHGPVILGAGRFVGLGLCRAIDPIEAKA